MQRLEARGKSQHRSALRWKSYGRAGRHGPIELFGTQQHTTGLVYLFLVWRLYEWKTAEKPNPPIPIAGMGFSYPRRGGRRKITGAVSGVIPDSEGVFHAKAGRGTDAVGDKGECRPAIFRMRTGPNPAGSFRERICGCPLGEAIGVAAAQAVSLPFGAAADEKRPLSERPFPSRNRDLNPGPLHYE